MVILVRETLTEEDWTAWRELAAQRERIARKKHRKLTLSWFGNKLCGIANTMLGTFTLCAVVSGGMKAAWAIALHERSPIRPVRTSLPPE